MNIGMIITKYRSWILSLLLAISGLIIYFILDPIGGNFNRSYNYNDNLDLRDTIEYSLRIAAASFFFFGSIAIAYTLEQLRWKWTLLYALTAASVIAAIAYFNSNLNYNFLLENISFWAGLLSLAISVPLFQNIRDNGAWKFEYNVLHGYAWTNVVIYFAALGFTLLSWLLLWALSALFQLIGIDFIRDLLRETWFIWLFLGATYGAAVGILRDNDKILAALQKVVLIILSILAPPFAAALLIFLLALLVNGFDTLWDATDSASTLLILCSAWGVILCNAVIRNDEENISASKLLNYSALILGIVILPIAFIASVSAGLRIGQYGLTPERIWGFLIIIIACAYGTAYFFNIIRHRLSWQNPIREANIKLAIGLCGVALFLALPILNFNSISAANQISRYDRGITDDESFDYAAMAFDFGLSGRELLKERSINATDVFKEQAELALKAESKWDVRKKRLPSENKSKQVKANMLAYEDVIITNKMIEILALKDFCQTVKCAITPMGINRFFVVESASKSSLGKLVEGRACELKIEGNTSNCAWRSENDIIFEDIEQFSIKDVTQQQLFIGDKAVGKLFDSEK